jgi:hypothetical protein
MQKPKTRKPFFARFLESQELAKVNGAGTLKFPSDRDEDSDPLAPSGDKRGTEI